MSHRAHLYSLPPDQAGAAADPLETAFRANARLVYSIALRILKSMQDAEDLLQDVFISARRDLRDLAHPAAVRQWFAIATVRQAKRRLQRRRLFSIFGTEDVGYTDAIAPEASPEQHSMLRSIYRVLDRLPVNERLAWTLRHIEGMSLEMVATACGCSLATAKRRIGAAHDVIAEALRDE
ncbi:MAG: RNA polymerase sigma factor [Myxococcota bacterium]